MFIGEHFASSFPFALSKSTIEGLEPHLDPFKHLPFNFCSSVSSLESSSSKLYTSEIFFFSCIAYLFWNSLLPDIWTTLCTNNFYVCLLVLILDCLLIINSTCSWLLLALVYLLSFVIEVGDIVFYFWICKLPLLLVLMTACVFLNFVLGREAKNPNF